MIKATLRIIPHDEECDGSCRNNTPCPLYKWVTEGGSVEVLRANSRRGAEPMLALERAVRRDRQRLGIARHLRESFAEDLDMARRVLPFEDEI